MSDQGTVHIIVGTAELKDLFHEACADFFQTWHENTRGGCGGDHLDWVELTCQLDGAERQMRILAKAEGLLNNELMDSLSIVKNHFTEKASALVNSFKD